MANEMNRFLKLLSDCAAMDYPRAHYKDGPRTARFWNEPFDMFAGKAGVDFAIDQPERTVWALCTCYYTNKADSLGGNNLLAERDQYKAALEIICDCLRDATHTIPTVKSQLLMETVRQARELLRDDNA